MCYVVDIGSKLWNTVPHHLRWEHRTVKTCPIYSWWATNSWFPSSYITLNRNWLKIVGGRSAKQDVTNLNQHINPFSQTTIKFYKFLGDFDTFANVLKLTENCQNWPKTVKIVRKRVKIIFWDKLEKRVEVDRKPSKLTENRQNCPKTCQNSLLG